MYVYHIQYFYKHTMDGKLEWLRFYYENMHIFRDFFGGSNGLCFRRLAIYTHRDNVKILCFLVRNGLYLSLDKKLDVLDIGSKFPNPFLGPSVDFGWNIWFLVHVFANKFQNKVGLFIFNEFKKFLQKKGQFYVDNHLVCDARHAEVYANVDFLSPTCSFGAAAFASSVWQ